MKNCLRKIRREADITQQELADAVNTTRQTIHAIERGKIKTTSSYELLLSIARFFEKEVSDIFFIDNGRQELQKRNTVKREKVTKEVS
ncbi:hypothetical protein AWH48_12250 [Domibacillus aminovorans]|uniref:HTH cro/C1-type domain-containing protein n=1 Tax=Domibacillus aminovorans TaxID=29332 RepID=A0A177KKL4_9BACI|nr:helix-turn-helix domain-containing protein [Domibacillus aminovorans]OAH53121.1 hypothetical protein AWH48_12250 [Domibacillus aminovorans]